MNRPLYFLFLPLFLLCSGCTLFHSTVKKEDTQRYLYINQTRFHTITASGKFVCLIDKERPPAQQTIQDIIKIAEQSALMVEFRSVSHSLQIPAQLRAGKADVAIGNYKAADAKEKHLDHLTIRKAVCLLRKDDPDWKKLLTSGVAILNAPNEKK